MKARKYLCLLLAVLLMMLSGCNRGGNQSVEVLRNDKYAIRQNDEGFFLEFHDDVYETEYRRQKAISQKSGVSSFSPIPFSSVANMKEAIKTGDFTVTQLVQMHFFERVGGDKVGVCDLNNLYDARLPEDVTLRRVNWYGKTYSISFYGDNRWSNCGSISLITKARYEEWIEKLPIKFEGKEDVMTLVSKSVDPQTNGTVTCYEYNGLKKQIHYSYTEGGNTVTVKEMYREEEKGMEIPSSIAFYGNCGDQYFSGSIEGLKERPSYEWIKSFGLMPFVEKT